MDYSFEVDFLYRMWLETIKSKNLETAIRGKRAKTLIAKLLEKHSLDEISKVFQALPPQSKVELFELLNDKKFEKYLKDYEQGIVTPIFSPEYGRKLFISFVNTYVPSKIKALKNRELTYVDFLLELPLEDERVKWWLVTDEVFNLINKYKLIPPEKILLYRNALASYYRRRSWVNKLKMVYKEVIALPEYKPLREVIEESLEVVKEWIDEVR